MNDVSPTKGEVEIKALLEAMAAAADRRDRANAERFAQLEQKLSTVISDKTATNLRIEKLEEERASVRTAMTSHHEIELGLRADIQELGKTFHEHLDRQDEAQRHAQEAQRRESLAAKKLADDRAQANIEASEKTKRMAIWVPIVGAAIALLGSIVSVVITANQARAAAADAEARQAARYSSIEQRLVEPRALAAPAPTAAASSMPSPPAQRYPLK